MDQFKSERNIKRELLQHNLTKAVLTIEKMNTNQYYIILLKD